MRRNVLRIYFLESKYEVIKFLRSPVYAFFVVGSPLLLFFLIALPSSGQQYQGYSLARYLIATYSCYGAMTGALFATGAGIAMERGYGWLDLKRVAAMPQGAYVVAKIAASAVFGLIVTGVLLTAGAAFHLNISGTQALGLLGAIMGSVLVFAAFGTLIGVTVPRSNAAGFLNIVFLPMSLVSGLWIPLGVLPHWVQAIAHVLPSYYCSRIALEALGYLHESGSRDWVVVFVYGTAIATIAAWTFRRQEAAT